MKYLQSKKLIDEYGKYIFSPSWSMPYIITKGKGSYIWDVDGNKILDVNAGQFSSIFGHAWSGLEDVVTNQLKKIIHTSTQVITPEILSAAKEINSISTPLQGSIIFLSTGSEAVECALRFAKHIKGKSGFLCLENGYHGLTLGAQSVTFAGKWAIPQIDCIKSIPVPIFHEIAEDEASIKTLKILQDLDTYLSSHKDEIAGCIMEPIVSVGGMIFLSKEYIEGIYTICKKHGILLIYDECQTGMGRTGTWFAYQQYDVVPDILITAKGVGVGFPVSLVMFNATTIDTANIQITQYSSHQNDPLSAVIASRVIEEIKEHEVLSSIKEKGQYFLSQLLAVSKEHEFICNPRGKGLMLGFDISDSTVDSYRALGKRFSSDLLKKGVLLQSTNQGRVYRLLPNYYITHKEIDYFMQTLKSVI